ncbi:hypothetical protein GLW08_20485 [Pontibacillus yanchengensis]|uniref:Uncharacterized protein n=2 Tax=Pontibacillus yanchengensis TaxID=462910 RepID=A0ACC7VLL3_9BACI|nr:hypothetical protein [Pontibacillus yanchengensis]MYL35483.1 hypothetical protein [Pontibacillus yanchengensis]MYL55683.1 hypothetical protein [Pontibacillus yanchengensis]
MRVGVHSSRANITQTLESIPSIQAVQEFSSIDELKKDKKVKAILLDQNGFNTQDLLSFREVFPNHHFIILMKEKDEFFEKSCIAHDIKPVFNDIRDDELKNIIQTSWFKEKENTDNDHVIAIRGTHRQCGTTQTSLSLARSFAAYNRRVAVVGLNPYNPGYVRGLDNKYSLDYIYDHLESDVIRDAETLMKYMDESHGVHYLPGNSDLYKAPSFKETPIKRMIQYLKREFDIVILDVGSFYDSFLAMTALKEAGTHILIATQEVISLNEYQRWNEQIIDKFDLELPSSYLVVNKYATNAIITPKHISETLDIPMISHIPFFPEAADAEYEDGVLYDTIFKPYNRAIDGIAKALNQELVSEGKKANKNWFSSIKEKMFS